MTILSPEQEVAVARERLRLLSLGYYISGGIGIFYSCFILLYAVIFSALSFIPASQWNSPPKRDPSVVQSNPTATATPASHHTASSAPPIMFFRIFGAVAGFLTLCAWTLAGLTIYCGRCLQKRKKRLLVYIVGCINMIFIPYGTLLGIATIFALQNKTVTEEFEQSHAVGL